MSTIASLGNTIDTANGQKQLTITPTLNDLIVLLTSHTNNSAISTVAPTDNNSGGAGTYALAESRTKVTDNGLIQAWIRNDLIRAGTSTTFTHNPGTTNGGGILVYRVTLMSRVGLNAKRQSTGTSNVASSTPSITMPSAILTTNPVIGAIFNSTAPPTFTPPAGFTEQPEVGYSVPTATIEVVFASSAITATTLNWTGNSPTEYAELMVELDASPDEVPLMVSRIVGMG